MTTPISAPEQDPTPTVPAEIWAAIDDVGQPCHAATWPEACQEHINDAIAEHDLDEAKTWVVRRYALAPLPELRAQWGRLYATANALVARIGYKGEVDRRADEVASLMDALHDLDGGQWMPGLMPAATASPATTEQPADKPIGWCAVAISKSSGQIHRKSKIEPSEHHAGLVAKQWIAEHDPDLFDIKAIPVFTCPQTAPTEQPKPLDDPRLQGLFGDAIEGALALGFQNSSPPPEGHWLARFWNIGSAEAHIAGQIEEWQAKAKDYDRLAGVARNRRLVLEEIAGTTNKTATPEQLAQHLQRLAQKAVNDYTFSGNDTHPQPATGGVERPPRERAKTYHLKMAYREDARAVLAELVAVKNLKEQIKAYNPQFLWTGEEQKVYAAMAEEYDRRQPLAWEAARSVLSGEPAPTDALCPRPINTAPDDQPAAECIAAGNCGCGLATRSQAPEVAPVPAKSKTDVQLVEQLALRVGMKSLMNNGAASCVYSEGCNGVSQAHLIAFTEHVALHCVAVLSQGSDAA